MRRNPAIVKLKKIPRKLLGLVNPRLTNTYACLINSFPKSGTHLLSQVFDQSYLLKDYDRFITMASSINFREKGLTKINREIRNIRSKELVKGHIFYREEIIDHIKSVKLPTFFIYRDLRSCLVSEVFYLSSMNRFHKLSKYFDSSSSIDSLLKIAIEGLPNGGPTGLYKDINQRFLPFKGWVEDENIMAIRFEDLNENPRDTIEKIWIHFINRTDLELDLDKLIHSSLTSINPERSHTFREGKSKGWDAIFDKANYERFIEVCGDLNESLGYDSAN